MAELLGFLAWLGVSVALASLGAWRHERKLTRAATRNPARLPVKRPEPA